MLSSADDWPLLDIVLCELGLLHVFHAFLCEREEEEFVFNVSFGHEMNFPLGENGVKDEEDTALLTVDLQICLQIKYIKLTEFA